MAKQKSLKLNIVMNAILTMSTFLFPLITYPYASRILRPEGMGKVAFAASLIAQLDMIAQLGIPTYGIRACAKVRDDRAELSKTARELLTINVICMIAAYVIFILALLFIPRLQDEKLLYVVMSFSVFCNSIGMEWLYKALENYSYITVRSIVFKLISVIAMFFLVKAVDDYIIYGGIVIFAGSASNILNLINARKHVNLRTEVNWAEIKDHLKPILVFFSMSCATIIYTNLDTVMLGFMSSNEEVGFYNAAVRIKIVLVSVVTSLGAVLLPRMTYYVENRQENAFYATCRKALHFVFVLAVPMSLYFIMLAPEGIRLLSGPLYGAAVPPMRIIMPTLLLVGITNILGLQILVPLGRERDVLISEIAGAVTDLILNAILIPLYGASGAALGTLTAEIVVLCVQAGILRDKLALLLGDLQVWKILLATAIAACGVWTLQNILQTNVFLTLVATSALFGFIYALILLLTRDTVALEIAGMIRGLASKVNQTGEKHE